MGRHKWGVRFCFSERSAVVKEQARVALQDNQTGSFCGAIASELQHMIISCNVSRLEDRAPSCSARAWGFFPPFDSVCYRMISICECENPEANHGVRLCIDKQRCVSTGLVIWWATGRGSDVRYVSRGLKWTAVRTSNLLPSKYILNVRRTVNTNH